MTDAHAITSAPRDAAASGRLEQAGVVALFGVAAALQFSIAVAQALLAIAVACWLGLVLIRQIGRASCRERV